MASSLAPPVRSGFHFAHERRTVTDLAGRHFLKELDFTPEEWARLVELTGRLREGVEIMRQMWTTGSGTLDGTHYQVAGALNFPLPLQGSSIEGSPANGIPLWIAGGARRSPSA